MRMGRARPRQIEHGIQAGLFDWRNMMLKRIPLLRLLHAIPNGAKLPFRKKLNAAGKVVRSCPQAVILKREGLTAGVPDVCWPVPRGRYHGLYIEHKAPDAPKPGEEQAQFIADLRNLGYFVHVSRQCDESVRLIEAYWNLGDFMERDPYILTVKDDYGAGRFVTRREPPLSI